MPSEVIVTPELLAAQGVEMASLMSEYESLFSSVSSLLAEINSSWSPNMANNFSGKIQSAQKSFSNVVGMLGNGSSAAKAASQIFADDLAGAVGNILGLMEQGSDFSDWVKNALGAADVPGLKGLDLGTLQQASDLVQKGDYDGALKKLAEKGLDIGAGKAADLITGNIDTSDLAVFQELNEATGGKLSVLGYLANFPQKTIKSTITETIGSLAEAAQKAGSGDTKGAMQSLLEAGWNGTFGGAQKAWSDTVWNTIQNTPAGEYYKEKGAKSGADAIGVALGSVYEAVTGDTEGAEYFNTYYSRNGGIGGGMVNGMKDIIEYAGEKLGSFSWKSILK
ncbi:MAG: hypothetical protein Q4C02_07040 [Eubacteriales bacterium]|nr:hypothetical protein [Eubacteriales bacterium]